jgi:hypothetical protein
MRSGRWGDRWRDPDTGDPAFDGAFALSTNDEPLMRAWLDDESRRALLASTYEFETAESLLYEVGDPTRIARRTWTYELANDELVATKGAFEGDPERFMVAIRTACTIGARSQRWAAEYAELARSVGAHAASEIELGGAPVLTATRSSIEVAMQLVRKQGRGSFRIGAGVERRFRVWALHAELRLVGIGENDDFEPTEITPNNEMAKAKLNGGSLTIGGSFYF